ncbi:MAG: hypothetical protein JO257_11280 [Deltaproteobacteria bacterium]|nr:hypothetical protein [Deltaproteobacteria bacterium]
MRPCPFCSAENADELAVCQACGRRLPPLPPRRARNAPPTGIQLPPRPASTSVPPPMPRKPPSVPPPQVAPAVPPSGPQITPMGPPSGPQIAPMGAPSGPQITVGTAPQIDLPQPRQITGGGPNSTQLGYAPNHDATTPGMSFAPTPATGLARSTTVSRESAPALPPPPPTQPPPMGAPISDSSRDELLNALNPAPAAARREAPVNDSPIIGDRRGRNPSDSKAPPLSPAAFNRPKTASQPPPMMQPAVAVRPKTSSVPPPIPERASTSSSFRVEGSSSPMPEPPPTRIHRADATDRPFTPPKVQPVPEIPEPGLVNSARYTYQFVIAWWQRRGAIKQLAIEIKQDTEALDQVLGSLGRVARTARVEGRVFSVENAGISAAEERVAALQKEGAEVEARKAEENSKFVDIERERNAKLTEAERMLEEAQRELTHLEAQRRSLRDKRKELERRQKAYLKSAEDQDRQAGSAPMGDQRQDLRRSAEQHRKEAAALEPDRQEIDRRLGSLERPIAEATAKLDAAKAELDGAKRSLNDAREGHTHRLAELDAEDKRKNREIALAEGEIARRLVTLGTLVNLNRIEDPQFSELYQRIDRLRGAITARTTEIEKLTAEREAKDKGTFWRGVATIGGALMLLILLIVILLAIL